MKKVITSESAPKVDFEKGTTSEVGGANTHDAENLTTLGYEPQLHRNRSMFTLLFQSLAIAAVCLAIPPSPSNHSSRESLMSVTRYHTDSEVP